MAGCGLDLPGRQAGALELLMLLWPPEPANCCKNATYDLPSPSPHGKTWHDITPFAHARMHRMLAGCGPCHTPTSGSQPCQRHEEHARVT